MADGLGDGLALSIWLGSKHNVSKCFDLPYPHSLGLLYASVTGYLGYKPFRHEGKVTGLSARGQPTTFVYPFHLTVHIHIEELPLHFRCTIGFNAWMTILEDIAAWLQEGIETELLGHYTGH